MHIYDVIATNFKDVLSELLDVDRFGCALHHDHDDVFDNRNRGKDHNDGEQIRANRVSVPHAREEVNQNGSYNYADAH